MQAALDRSVCPLASVVGATITVVEDAAQGHLVHLRRQQAGGYKGFGAVQRQGLHPGVDQLGVVPGGHLGFAHPANLGAADDALIFAGGAAVEDLGDAQGELIIADVLFRERPVDQVRERLTLRPVLGLTVLRRAAFPPLFEPFPPLYELASFKPLSARLARSTSE